MYILKFEQQELEIAPLYVWIDQTGDRRDRMDGALGQVIGWVTEHCYEVLISGICFQRCHMG